MSEILIGIDPAFRQKGFGIAILDESNELNCFTLNGETDFIDWINHEMPAENVKVCIENSNLQKTMFTTPKSLNGWISQFIKAKFPQRKSMIQSKETIARSVGKNQAVSQIAYKMLCNKIGTENVKNLSPKQKGVKWLPADNKIIDGICKHHKIVRAKKTWNQDERDAFKLLTFLL